MKPYYEGWYLKQERGDQVLALIPGRAQDSAFIQVITPQQARFIPYPLEAFGFTGSRMRVGQSTFSPHGMNVDIRADGLELRGQLHYRGLTPLRSDIMGPFAHLPMETKHMVFSMRHRVSGKVRLNGELLSFDGGVGYMEGDRGHSFPQRYTWVQSVDLPGDASVMLSIAEIPLFGVRFTGCIGIVELDGAEHRFATYRGVRIVQDDERAAEVAQGRMRLRVEVPETHGGRLQAPTAGAMERPIRESPAVPARIRFERDGEVLLAADAARTSFEHVEP